MMPNDNVPDPEIAGIVELLRQHGVETFESCQGGEGHCFPAPTIRFHGHRDEGYRVVALALAHGLPAVALRRYWTISEGELTGPQWEITFDFDAAGWSGIDARAGPGRVDGG